MALILGDDPTCGIQKRVLHAGKNEIPTFVDGTKVTFHYQTRKCDDEKTVLDDSRKDNKPMELIIGKKFKLEAWEKCLKTMRIGEVASFTVVETFTAGYPLVAKSLRDIRKGKDVEKPHHCCGMTVQEQGLGYPDLDELMKKPQPLEFILDVEKVESPGDYKKDTWAMDEGEKVAAIPRLKEEGNALYMKKQYTEASDKYATAIGMLDQLMLREKPNDNEWTALNSQKLPLLLNYSQCKLLLEDFYPVIEHTSEVLKHDPDNVKALYRRGRAHAAVWNPDEAEGDLRRVVELDPSLTNAANKELRLLEEARRQKDRDDREKLQGKMFS